MVSQEKRDADLKALQDAIYRDKILRARAMTPEQRLEEAFELCNSVLLRMHDGAMWQLNTQDKEEGWHEVGRRIDRLRAVRDVGRISEKDPRVSHES